MDIIFYYDVEIISIFQYFYFLAGNFSHGIFFPFFQMGFFPWDFFPREKIPMGFFKNSVSCINFMLLCSGQYCLYFVAFAHQLYTIFIILTVPCKLK